MKVATRHEMPVGNSGKLQTSGDQLTLTLERQRNSLWLPISPARTEKGAWVSLAKVVGEEKAQPIPLGTPNPKLSSCTVVAMDVDISVAAKLGLGNIFGGTLNYNDRAFYLDATAFTDRYSETPGNLVVGTRWGIGLRVLLKVSDIKAGMTLNFGIVGAAVQFGYAKALYEVDGIGLGVEGLRIVLGELHGFGDCTAETFFKINDLVIPKLGEYLVKNAADLTPEPYQVQLIGPIDMDPIVAARPILFGMRRLRDGKSLNEALAMSAGKYDGGEIRAVYAKIAPGLEPNETPRERDRDSASDYLADN
jgi:hypothetical protein